MKAYKVWWDEDWPHNYDILARSKWGLPGVECPDCGFTGGTIGLRYPSLLLPGELDPAPYLEAWPVTPERQSQLRAPLLKAWGQNVPLPPGAEFGPLVGKAWGKCGDVGWAGFSMLMTVGTEQRLRQAGITSLKLVPTKIKWRSRQALDYFELDIPATARFSPSYLQRLRLFDGAVRCHTCGFLRPKSRELPERKARLAYEELSYYIVLYAPSLPPGWDLLRIQDAHTSIIASEHFRAASLELGLTNITFREVAVETLLLTCSASKVHEQISH